MAFNRVLKAAALCSTSLVNLFGPVIDFLTPTPVGADPVTAAVTSFFISAGVGATTAAILGGLVVNMLGAIAVSALTMMMAKKPEFPGGLPTEAVTTGATTPMKFILGTYATQGQLLAPPMVHTTNKKRKNQWLTYVMGLGDIPINDIVGYIVDGEETTFSGLSGLNSDGRHDYGLEADGRLRGALYMRHHKGNQTQADPMLVKYYGNYFDRPWTNAHKLIGVPYAVMTAGIDDSKWNGLPDVRYVVKGISLYDPRLDSTNGGSGSHRFGVPSTYEFSENGIVQIYNILRGITIDGSIYGVGAKASAFPNDRWFAAMNACDELIDGKPRYRASLEVSLDNEPMTVIEELLKTCGGIFAEDCGTYLVSVGAPELPVAHITDDEILISEDHSEVPFEGLADTVNIVRASFPNPDNLWEKSEAVPFSKPEYVIEDGGLELVEDLMLSACPYPEQVRRLMRESLADHRRRRVSTLTLPPAFLNLSPLDTITYTSESRFYEAKAFQITQMTVDASTLNVRITMKERDPSDYDLDAVSDAKIPTYPSRNVVAPVYTSTDVDFTVAGASFKDDKGVARRPLIEIKWEGDNDFSGLNYQVRAKGTTQVLNGTVADPKSGSVTVDPVAPNVVYQVRMQVLSYFTETAWSSWKDVTTPDVRFGLDDLSEDVKAQFGGGSEMIEAVEAIRDEAKAHMQNSLSYSLASNTAYNATLLTKGEMIALANTYDQKIALANSAALSANTSRSQAAANAATAVQAAQNATSTLSLVTQQATLSASTVAASLPATFEDNGKYWTSSQNGKPEDMGGLNAAVTYGVDPVYGSYVRIPAAFGSQLPVLTKGVTPFVAGRTYRFSTVIRVLGSGAVAPNYIGLRASFMNGDYSYGQYSNAGGSIPFTMNAGDTWRTFTQEWTVGSADRAWSRFGLIVNGAEDNKTVDIAYVKIEDVTSEIAGMGFATAAAGSATLAQSYANNSLVSASASEASRLAANTIMGQVEQIETRTVALVQTSNGHMNSANTSARNAANSANTAAGHANAAESFSITATQQAGIVSTIIGTGTGVLKDQFLGHGTSGWGTFTTAPVWSSNSIYPIGREARWNLNASTSGGLQINSDNAAWISGKNAAGFVVDVEFTLNSGSLGGSGILIDWNSSSFRVAKSLESMLDQPLVTGQVMKAQAVFVKPANFTAAFVRNTMYFMANYSGNGLTRAAGDITVHRLAVRTATAEELGGGAIVGPITSIVNDRVESFASNEFGSLTSRVNAIQATANGATASVKVVQDAIAAINGALSGSYVISTAANGNPASLGLYSASNGSAAHSSIRLNADTLLLDGSVRTKHLSIGDRTNLLYNTDLSQGLMHYRHTGTGQAHDNTTLDLRPPSTSGNYAGSTYPTIYLQYDGSTAGGYTDLQCMPENRDGGFLTGYACAAGDWVEFSAQASIHRAAEPIMRVQWLNAAGAAIGASTVAVLPEHSTSSSVNPEIWPRYGSVVQAPANTAFARPFFRINGRYSGSGDASAFLFVHKPMFGLTKAGAELSPWSNGGQTVIDGGTMRAGSLSADDITTGRMNARLLDVTEQLTLQEKASFNHGKSSLNDPKDGLFFGMSPQGANTVFGFSVSRTVGDRRQSVDFSQNQLTLKNARYVVTSSETPVTVTYTSNRSKIAIPSEAKSLTVRGIGGGGSGNTGRGGNSGGTTTIRLYDGNTLKLTLTCAGGNPKQGGKTSERGHSNTFGNASAWPAATAWSGENAKGYGGGGGGGRYTTGRNYWGGMNGTLQASEEIDISKWANPMIEVTVGSAGMALNSTNSDYNAGNGGAGIAEMTYRGNVDLEASVIPHVPTATGTFQKPSGTQTPQSFPNLGAGLWVLDNGNNDLGLDEITISPAVTTWAGVAKNITFVSSMTPTYKPGGAAQTIKYIFYRMGGL